MKLKLDLHVHTHCSNDSLITLNDLLFFSKKKGLNGVAITDHDRIDCALKMARKANILIIPSIEVSSLSGHIIGLNVKEKIPINLSINETIDKIHEIGGIAVASHPCAKYKQGIGSKINSNFDAIEVINASAFPFKFTVEKTQKIATQLGIPGVAGSDAHYGPEIGYAYTIIDSEFEIDKIISAIKNGKCQPMGNSIPLLTRFQRSLMRLKGNINPLPDNY